MTSPIFPDAEDVALQILEPLGVPTANAVPNPRPASFVVARRVGGPRRNVATDEPSLGLEFWAASPADAHDLAQQGRALIHDAVGTVVGGVAIYRVTEFSGPVNFPDPISDQPRYTLTVAVAMREAV